MRTKRRIWQRGYGRSGVYSESYPVKRGEENREQGSEESIVDGDRRRRVKKKGGMTEGC